MTFSRAEKLLCLRSAKSRYLSYVYARKEMYGLIREQGSGNNQGRRMRVYHCNYCQGFHFGSTYRRTVRTARMGTRRRRFIAAYARSTD